MKLYNLYEEVILEGLITESVSSQQIIDTIDGEYANNGRKFIRMIKIYYDGDDVKDKFGNVTRNGKGERNIVVHAFGQHKSSGRDVIRAMQLYGDTLRSKQPKGWKLFRLDRISHWEPTNLKYWEPFDATDDPNFAGQTTNLTGDKSMMGGVKVVDFTSSGQDKGDEINKDNEYIDTKADTYRYDNAETAPVEPEEEEVETNEVPSFDAEDGVGFDDENIRNVLDDEPEDDDYEEEDIENNDEIKDY